MKNYLILSIALFYFSCEPENTAKEYYDSGELMVEFEVNKGKKDGFFKYYNKAGTLKLEYFNKDGIRHGPIIKYYDNGQIESKGLMRDGEIIWTEFFDENGIQLNRFENKNYATYFTYYSDTSLSSIEYSTHVYDSTKTDSLLFMISDSGYFFSDNPEKKIMKYSRIAQSVYLTYDYKNNRFDTLNSWLKVTKLKKNLLGPDTIDKGYIPTIHR